MTSLDHLLGLLRSLDGVDVRFRWQGGALAHLVITPAGADLGILAPARPSAIEVGLAEVLTDQPQTAKVLARLAGYTFGAHVRRALAAMVRMQRAVHSPDGYRRPP